MKICYGRRVQHSVVDTSNLNAHNDTSAIRKPIYQHPEQVPILNKGSFRLSDAHPDEKSFTRVCFLCYYFAIFVQL